MMPLTVESFKDNVRLIDRKTKLVTLCVFILQNMFMLPNSHLAREVSAAVADSTKGLSEVRTRKNYPSGGELPRYGFTYLGLIIGIVGVLTTLGGFALGYMR